MKFLGIVLALAISIDAIKVKEEDKAKAEAKWGYYYEWYRCGNNDQTNNDLSDRGKSRGS